MESIQKDEKIFKDEMLKENLRVQKTAYIKQQLERQRAAEDARLEHLMQEQEIIEGLRESTDDSMWQTEETRKYNLEFQERMNMQIYEANGITGDKMKGMREYKEALYRGAAAALFVLSLALIVLCGVLHGFQSDICLLMYAYTAMEGALLSQEKKRPLVLEFICRILYFLTFPTMLVMFVCYELKFETYGLFLPYVVILGTVVTVLGAISYFLHDPYRQDKKKLRGAKNQIRDIEKLAGKEIRKNQKSREKEERDAKKLQEREERDAKKRKEREEREERERLKKMEKIPDETTEIITEETKEEETVTEETKEDAEVLITPMDVH